MRPLRAVVSHVQHDTQGKGALDIQVPHLDVRERVVQIRRKIADTLWRWETIRQGDDCSLGDLVRLHIGEGRLIGEVLYEVRVLRRREVDAVASADNRILQRPKSEAYARRQGSPHRIDQGARILSGVRADSI